MPISAQAEPSQKRIWTSPRAPKPRILPARSSIGVTEESKISITRLSFSSLTPCSRKPEELKMEITSRMEKA